MYMYILFWLFGLLLSLSCHTACKSRRCKYCPPNHKKCKIIRREFETLVLSFISSWWARGSLVEPSEVSATFAVKMRRGNSHFQCCFICILCLQKHKLWLKHFMCLSLKAFSCINELVMDFCWTVLKHLCTWVPSIQDHPDSQLQPKLLDE